MRLVDVEVSGAGDAVEQVQVVGQNAAGEQPLAQARERVGVVVDAAQQHGLIQQRRQRGLQRARARARRSRRARSRDCVDDENRLAGACRAAARVQPVVDALGDRDRKARVDPHASSRPCRRAARGARARRRFESDSGSPPLKIASVASRHVAQLVRARPTSRRAPRAAPVRKLAAEAVAAVHGAGAARDQQHAARVLADDAVRRAALARARDRREKPAAARRARPRAASTWRSSGSCGSRLRMRATKPRGTSSGNARAAGGAERGRRQLEQPQQLGRVADRVAQRGLPRRQRERLRSVGAARLAAEPSVSGVVGAHASWRAALRGPFVFRGA